MYSMGTPADSPSSLESLLKLLHLTASELIETGVIENSQHILPSGQAGDLNTAVECITDASQFKYVILEACGTNDK